MNGNILVQLGFVIIAIVLIVSFIQPTFMEVSELQDEIFAVQSAASQATQLNNDLQAKVAQSQAIPSADLEALNTYLPESIDKLGVMNDINQIASQAGVSITSLTVNDEENALDDDISLTDIDEAELESYQQLSGSHFTVSVQGSYSGLKRFLELSSQNEYPLQISALTSGEAIGEEATAEEADSPAADEETEGIIFAIDFFVPRFTTSDTSSDNR